MPDGASEKEQMLNAICLEPKNPELRKQYSEIKLLHMEKLTKNPTVPAKHAFPGLDKLADKNDITSYPSTISQKDSFMEVELPIRAAVEIRDSDGGRSKVGSGVIVNENAMQSRDDQKHWPEASIQELASRAASRYMTSM